MPVKNTITEPDADGFRRVVLGKLPEKYKAPFNEWAERVKNGQAVPQFGEVDHPDITEGKVEERMRKLQEINTNRVGLVYANPAVEDHPVLGSVLCADVKAIGPLSDVAEEIMSDGVKGYSFGARMLCEMEKDQNDEIIKRPTSVITYDLISNPISLYDQETGEDLVEKADG